MVGGSDRARPGMSHGTGSIQDCGILLKMRARCALVQSVSRGLKAPSWDQ